MWQQTDGPVDAPRLCLDRSGGYPLRAFLCSAGIKKLLSLVDLTSAAEF